MPDSESVLEIDALRCGLCLREASRDLSFSFGFVPNWLHNLSTVLPSLGYCLPFLNPEHWAGRLAKSLDRLPVSRAESCFQTGCLIFMAINISLIILFLWGLKLKLTGFSRYNFNIVTVNTFRSSPGGNEGGRLPSPRINGG